MNKKEFVNLLLIFLLWKLEVIIFTNFSQLIFPLRTDFLGGGLLNYLRNPIFWGNINFDGEHYLSIARDGYLPFTYFYFPLYPILISVLARIVGNSYVSYAWSGIILSNIFCYMAIVGIYRLAKIIFNEKTAIYSICLLFLFPTSFFLGAYYNESLFLFLAVWSFYFAFKKKWLVSFILCGLATSTRLVGIALVPAIFYEYLQDNKNNLFRMKTFLYILISFSGILFYMSYLFIKTGDALAFFHNVEIFGGQRSTSLVTLPQVFYRYIFKILPVINYSYIPQSYMTLLELVTAIIFLVGLYYLYKLKKYSFLIYSALAYLIPTLSGSFSSFPRYALAMFPIFYILGKSVSEKSKPFEYILFAVLLTGSFVAVSLFLRGYFIS